MKESAAAPLGGGAGSVGTETILIVEDEAALRRLLQRTLVSLGYAILEAGSGDHALAIQALYFGPIHLMLTNINLPDLSGPALVRRMIAARPDIRIMYVSGDPYSDEWTIPGRRVEFLQKPVTLAETTARIRQCLNRSPLEQED